MRPAWRGRMDLCVQRSDNSSSSSGKYMPWNRLRMKQPLYRRISHTKPLNSIDTIRSCLNLARVDCDGCCTHEEIDDLLQSSAAFFFYRFGASFKKYVAWRRKNSYTLNSLLRMKREFRIEAAHQSYFESKLPKNIDQILAFQKFWHAGLLFGNGRNQPNAIVAASKKIAVQCRQSSIANPSLHNASRMLPGYSDIDTTIVALRRWWEPPFVYQRLMRTAAGLVHGSCASTFLLANGQERHYECLWVSHKSKWWLIAVTTWHEPQGQTSGLEY